MCLRGSSMCRGPVVRGRPNRRNSVQPPRAWWVCAASCTRIATGCGRSRKVSCRRTTRLGSAPTGGDLVNAEPHTHAVATRSIIPPQAVNGDQQDQAIFIKTLHSVHRTFRRPANTPQKFTGRIRERISRTEWFFSVPFGACAGTCSRGESPCRPLSEHRTEPEVSL